MSICLEVTVAIVNLDTLETTVKQVCILKHFIRLERIYRPTEQPLIQKRTQYFMKGGTVSRRDALCGIGVGGRGGKGCTL